MKKIMIKIGDIFSVKINNDAKKYFQYVANDRTQLNSNVIRVFKKKYNILSDSHIDEIINDDVDFYAHCLIDIGIKIGYWEKVGNISVISKVDVLFVGTSDYGRKLGQEPVKISENWYVWKINDEKFTKVGKLTGEYQKSEIGMVINPKDIVHRMQTGKYSFDYPGY